MSDEQPPSVPPGEPFKHLRPGDRYVVLAPFTDFEGGLHPRGESWTYLDKNFFPYERGLSLFVSADDGTRMQIQLQWEDEAQGEIIDNLERYVGAAA